MHYVERTVLYSSNPATKVHAQNHAKLLGQSGRCCVQGGRGQCPLNNELMVCAIQYSNCNGN